MSVSYLRAAAAGIFGFGDNSGKKGSHQIAIVFSKEVSSSHGFLREHEVH